MKTMVEFYSGSGRMAEAFRKKGWKAFTIDNKYAANLKADVLALTRQDIIDLCGGEPDALWFGTPCEGFSVAVIGRNWEYSGLDPKPKSESARRSMQLAMKCLEIKSWFPNAVWGVENPRGMLRMMPFMKNLPRRTVTYCQFGERRMKPTDIWTNLVGWNTPPPCKNGATCHDAAPRGSRTGTQGLKNAYERSAYPTQFCDSFVDAVTRGIA